MANAARTTFICIGLWLVSSVATITTVVAQAPEQRVSFNRLSIPGVESLGGIFAMAQDADGFIWFGGKNGLRRFDGYRVESFRHDAADPYSLANNDISTLFMDSRGQLWIGMLSGGGLDRYDSETGRFIHYQHQPSNPFSLGDNDVYALAEDLEGDLWIATHAGGLNRLEQSTGRVHRYPKEVSGLQESSVSDIAFDRFGTLWVATHRHGLHRMHFKRNEFYHYVHDPNDPDSLSDNQLYRLYIDQYDNLWVGTLAGGINRFNRDKTQFTRFQHRSQDAHSIGAGMVWAIAEDGWGQLWVATGNGALNRFDKWQNQFERFYADEYAPSALSGTVISMLADSAGDFWLGTYDTHLNRLSQRGPQFEVLRHSPENSNSVLSSSITALAQGADDRIWIASEKGLSHYHRDTGNYTHFVSREGRSNSLPSSPIRAMVVGQDKRLWLGTNGQGLWYKDADSQDFYPLQITQGESLDQAKIWSVNLVGDGSLWVGTQNLGLCRVDIRHLHTGCYTRQADDPDSLANAFVWGAYEDKGGRLWVATQSGLSLMTDQNNGKFINYHSQNSTLSGSSVHAVAEDNHGDIWIGTTTGLNRYDSVTQSFEVFGVQDGLADDSISAIVVDEFDTLWLTTLAGISRFDPVTKHFDNYDTRHGTASNTSALHNMAIVLHNGEMAFGSSNGLTFINPKTIRKNLFVPPVVLTDFYVNNQRQVVGSGILSKTINSINRIELQPEQNSFAIEFSALNFLVADQNHYQYKLVGFDDAWRNISAKQRRATYTNLDAGDYTFLVKGANNEGIWSDKVKQVHIRVLPKWWLNWPAYTVYTLVIFALLYGVWCNQLRRMAATQMLNRRLRDLDHIKDQFLTNISQELRTPLNSIIGLADNMLDGGAGEMSLVAQQQLQIIDESGQKLMRMVDDMLDFTQLSRDDVSLQCRDMDAQNVVERSVTWFRPIAEKKGLKLYYTLDNELPMIWADTNRIQQILFYLIDNAIKFTRHGYIEVILSSDRDYVYIQVADTGLGISQEHLETIFRSFEHGASQGRDASFGLGLGLSRVKQLVELHGGKILVESKPQKGSVFTVKLPVERTP